MPDRAAARFGAGRLPPGRRRRGPAAPRGSERMRAARIGGRGRRHGRPAGPLGCPRDGEGGRGSAHADAVGAGLCTADGSRPP
eukprot:3170330-Alexandrium_andersonii.AAC.1